MRPLKIRVRLYTKNLKEKPCPQLPKKIYEKNAKSVIMLKKRGSRC